MGFRVLSHYVRYVRCNLNAPLETLANSCLCAYRLGPFNAPYAVASIGLLPGICLYVLFGIFAFLGGMALWYLFLKVDSVRYPVKLYGDLGGRVFGTWCRHLFSLLQSVQLVLNVGESCSFFLRLESSRS